MKTTNILSKSITAAATLILCGVTAHAATLLNGTTGAGEIFVGFRATTAGSAGATTNVVIDLGSVSNLSLLGPGAVVVLGNLGTNLAVYNDVTLGNWYNRTDLLWSAVAGVGNTATADPTNTLYGSVANGNLTLVPGTAPATVGYTRAANGSQGSIATQILSMASGPSGFVAAGSGSSANIAIENTGDTNSWSSKFTGTPFSNFSNPPGQVFEQAFTSGTIALGVEGALDVYRMFKTGTADGDLGGATTGAGSYQFTLEISQTGIITANVLPVPEPASIGLLMTGGIFFLGRRRRIAAVRTEIAFAAA